MPHPSAPVRLRARDRTALKGMLHRGVQQGRVVLRVLALLHVDRGALAPAVARAVDLTDQAVRRIARRYQAGGVARAVFDAPRPGAAEVLSPPEKQRRSSGSLRWSARRLPRAPRAGPCA